MVLDARDNYNFVKRIPTFDVPASKNSEQVAGVTASTVTQMIYVATRGRLAAIDLATEKKVWENAYDGQCCERPQISPEGSFLYVGSDLKDFWYVVNPRTGALITKVVFAVEPERAQPESERGREDCVHVAERKGDGRGGDGEASLVKTITFGDNIRPFVLNHDSSKIYANVNNLLGFEIADVASGKILHRVEVQGFGWPDKWKVSPRPRIPHGCPSHGIALTPDEKEVWIVDGINQYIHIFDNTQMPPRQMDSIKTTAGPYWITIGLDGKLAYVSSGDVIDIKTRKIVGTLKDEYGRRMYSEKLLDMLFENGKLTRVVNQFGNGISSAVAAGRTSGN